MQDPLFAGNHIFRAQLLAVEGEKEGGREGGREGRISGNTTRQKKKRSEERWKNQNDKMTK